VSEIDTLVLDLGDVLVRWDPRRALVGRLPDVEVRAFLDDFDFRTFNVGQDAGRSWADGRALLRATAPHLVPAMDMFVEHFADTLVGPVPGMASVVQDATDAGLRLLGLTNWSAETFHLAEPAAPAIGLLEDVVVSGREGVAKPDPRIFDLLATRHGVDPGRAVFVDDSPANVAAARAYGFDAVLFTSAQHLRAELDVRGIALGSRPPAR